MKIFEQLTLVAQNVYIRGILYGIALVTLMLIFLMYFREVLPLIINKWYLLPITACLTVAALANQAAGYRFLLGEEGQHIQFNRLLRIWALSNLLNYLGPLQPGTIARSIVLKKYGVSLKASISASLHWVFVSASIGILLFSFFLISLPEPAFIYLGVGLLALSAFWLVLAGRIITWLLKRIKGLESGNSMFIIIAKLPRLGRVHSLILCQYLILTTIYFILYRSLSVDVTLIDSLGIATLIPLSTLVAITPNGVGIIESLIGYFSFLYHLDVSEGLFIILITRMSHVLVCFSVLLFCQE